MGLGDTGISSGYKVPRFIAKLIFAAGLVSAGSLGLRVLCVGMKTAGGSIVADQDVVLVQSVDEADTIAGPGSNLAMQLYSALEIDDVELYAAAVTEPGGGTAATATILLGGTVGNGVLRFRIAGVSVAIDTNTLMTIDDVGTALTAAFNAKTRTPVTAAYNSGTDTITLTCKNKGAGGKDWLLYHDKTDRAPLLTITLTGSAAVNTDGVRLGAAASGTGAEDVTTILTKLQTKRYARIAPGHNDATNAALWETHVNDKAGPLKLLLEAFVMGHNGSLANAQTLAQTTLNAFRAQLVWARNSENHPCQWSARTAAFRSVIEQATWVPDYDGFKYEKFAPQAFDTDLPTDTEQNTALNNGVTPVTTVDGTPQMVRGITTYCLNGAVQDERCLDVGDQVMPDQACMDLMLLYKEWRKANTLVGPNVADGEDEPPKGVGTPKMWESEVTTRAEGWYTDGWLEDRPIGIWAPKYTFNKPGRYILGDTPLSVRRVQHRIDNVIRQIHNT